MPIRKNLSTFPELEKAIIEKQITKKRIAENLGITPMALSKKLTGQREFKLSEVKYLHELFNDIPIEKLFNIGK